MKIRPWFSTLAVFLLLAGCATPARNPPPALTGDPVIDGKAALERAPERDRVLWQYRTALAAMRQGNFDEAKRLLDDALVTLGGIGGKDRNARKSRGLFSGENRKTFVGEPYERVMAYYYRGILYWRDGEPDNARACFRSAALADSVSESREFAADYVLLDYLDGLASTRMASDGSDAFKRAREEARLSPPPAPDTRANVLFFVECGQGPVKYATGAYAEELRFREGPSTARSAVIRIAGREIAALPQDDLYFQATTRGGRVMDHILANKAVFKSSTSTAGDAALIGGLVLSQNRRTQGAALGLAAFGVLSKIVSASTTPEADIRTWDDLPQYLSVALASLPAGTHPAVVEFRDAQGRVLHNLTKNVTCNVQPNKDTVIFLSDHSTTPQNL